MRITVGTVVVAALVATVPPATAAERPDVAAASPWAQAPTSAMWREAKPAQARAQSVGGRAFMRCKVLADGKLDACRVFKESPSAMGFGDALLAMAPAWRRKSADVAEVVLEGAWFDYDTAPDWRKKPTADDLLTVYPREAGRKGVGGRASIDCLANTQGALVDCVVLDETPAGMGFGSAALALTPQFLMKPATKGGQPVPSVVRFPINFKTYGPMNVAAGKGVLPANMLWIEAPTFADVVAAYPKKAREGNVGGHAVLNCDMTRQGRLNCTVATQEPANYGFGEAARQLSKLFRYPVNTPADAAATSKVQVHIPVTFDPGLLSGGGSVGKPTWAAVPSAGDQTAAFKDLKGPGTLRVQLKCTVHPGGELGDCAIAGEEPANAGLGRAAMTLVPKFKVSTWTVEGLPVVGGEIRVPLRYEGGS